MKKLLIFFVSLVATTVLWASDVITYTASSKLSETTDTWSEGLHTDAFNVSISSHTFSNGTGTITFSGEVTTIGGYAFYYCSGLTSVTIPSSVTTIGDGAFEYCRSLKKTNYTGTIADWCKIKFSSFFANPMYYSHNFFINDVEVKDLVIPEGVDTIGRYAFDECTGLTSVTIPNSVTTIGFDAFYGCRGLTSVTIPNSVTTIGDYAFDEVNNIVYSGIATGSPWGAKCRNGYIDGYLVYSDANKTKLCGCSSAATGEITIPNSVTTIGSEAFYRCYDLTSITIPNSVTTIGYDAFDYCSGLTKTNYTGTIADWCKIKFSNSYSNPISYSHNFYINDVEIKDLVIPTGVDTIGSSAFDGCSGLTSVTIPNSVKTIGDGAFYGCTSLPVIDNIRYADTYLVEAVDKSLSTYTIRECTKWIGDGAFEYCSGLTSITIPNSVTKIGRYAFEFCRGLTSVTIPSSVTTIGDGAFDGCSGLTSVTIPNSVTKIGSLAFSYCSGLTSVTIPSSVTTIGDGAFDGCSGLTKTNYMGNIADWCKIQFGNYSANPMYYSHNFFINDVEVKDLVIPEGVDTIGRYAFEYCSGLTSITCYATTPPTCAYNCFSNIDKTIPVYVPARSVDAYKKALYWRDFKNIQGFPNDYAIVTCSATNGTIKGDGKYIKGDTCTLTVTPSYGYKFTQWTDSVTDNPRSFVVTQDTSFMAEFAKNQYLISVEAENGVVSGGGYYEYQSYAQLTATADEHYHFVKWSDGNTSNPRNISVTEDKTYTAIFTLDQHSVSAIADHGNVFGIGTYDYGSEISLIVTPSYGYQFTQWSDGNTDNPRSFIVTQDTTFIAQLDIAYSGQCGDNLTWKYNDGVLVISGTGAMYDYTQGTAPWMLFFQDSISSLVINNGSTSIGNFAFYGLSNKNFKTIDIPNSVEQIGQFAFANCEYIKNVYLGLSLEKISANAFANDERLLYITCYAIEPPLLDESAFVNYDAYLSVPCASLADYKVAKGWKLFNKENVSCIGAEEKPITGDEVTVNPSADNVTITWPANDNASEYKLVITKDGIVFCTLTFNAQGQLTGIAFAPNRAGSRMLDAAVMTSNGWQFTVTGLDQASKYGYTLDALNASKQSIKHYEGEFATDGYTSLEWVTSDHIQGISKMLLDGHLYILRDGNLYTATGAKVK